MSTVRVGMADALLLNVVTALHQKLQRSAPGVSVVYLPWHIEVLQEHYLLFMRRDHPAARRCSLDAWLKFPHVVVSSRGDARGVLDDVLLRWRRQHQVGAVVPNFVSRPWNCPRGPISSPCFRVAACERPTSAR